MSQMKKPRVPYARRSVWIVIAALAVVLIAGLIVAAVEINHLRNEVTALQKAVSTLYASQLQSGSHK